MLESSAFWLVVLAALVAYLCWSVGLRRREQEARRRDREKQWQGTGFDVSAIAPQIQRVRQAHLGAVPPQPHRASYHRRLVAVVGRLMGGFSYFRRARLEQETPRHDA
jgi:hypothetical protein